MKGIKELQREKINEITLVPGDMITLLEGDKELMSETATRAYVIDEVVIFESDESVFGRPALGGAFIEK